MCQSKGGFSFLNMAKRVQGGSEGGAALAAVNQVNEACKVFQKSLANLMEGAQGCNFLAAGLCWIRIPQSYNETRIMMIK